MSATYQCQDPGCQEVIDAEDVLVLKVPTRTYPAGVYGSVTLTEPRTFPGYDVLLCPWCRGKLQLIPNNPS